MISACSETASAPESHAVSPASKPPQNNYLISGDEMTLYDEVGGWVKLNIATHQLFNSEVSTAVNLNPEDFGVLLNEFTQTMAGDDAAQEVDALPSPCTPENPCAEPMAAPIDPAMFEGNTSKAKKSRDGYIGFTITFNPHATRTQSFGTPTFSTMSWPPDCGGSWLELRTAKESYRATRFDAIGGLKRKLKDWINNLPSGVTPNYSDFQEAGEALGTFIRQKEAEYLLAMNTGVYNIACSQFGYPTVFGPYERFWTGPVGGGGGYAMEIACVTTTGWLRLSDGTSIRADFTTCEYVQM
jgi:hypothetical protein